MKHIINILPLIIFIAAAGCEKVDVIDNNTVYEEYTVIRGELAAGTLFNGITITKTLPFNESYTIEKAEIKNAHAYIRVNSVQIIPLHYTSDGLYKTLDEMTVRSGYNYELFVETDKTKAYSETTVPDIPTVFETKFYNDSIIEAVVVPQKDAVYGCIWKVMNSNATTASANDFYNIYFLDNANGYLKMNILSKEVPYIFRTDLYRKLLFLQVYAYDKSYMNYFRTKNNNQIIESIFAQGGGQIAWNVYGEKVIGMFIGSAVSSNIRVNN